MSYCVPYPGTTTVKYDNRTNSNVSHVFYAGAGKAVAEVKCIENYLWLTFNLSSKAILIFFCRLCSVLDYALNLLPGNKLRFHLHSYKVFNTSY
jgi:hypothetical protein